MMNRWKAMLLLMTLLALSQAAPVMEKAVEDEEGDVEDSEHTGLEYDKYLRMVVKTLENDPEMKKKLDELSLDDLKTGKMSEIMDGVSDKIRSRLDDLKRTEIQRLRHVARQRFQKANHRSMDQKSIDDMVGHIDINSVDQFGGKDFEKLIKKATEDLDKADSERKQEFKRYEMQKEIERRQKLQLLDEEKRKQVEKEYQEKHNKKKEKHLKHPGSKPQLEQVWEETDHLEKDDFNPKTFFQLHDTNNDNNLDVFELEALFVKQVEKMYSDRGNADPTEKLEEISLMREHFMNEIDTDKDHMVSKKEFLAAADSDDFEEDKGWEDLDEKDIYTEEELGTYEKRIQDEMRNLKLKMQKEHEAFKQQKQGGAGDPVNMNQGGQQDPDQLANQIIQNAADKEAENFHEAHGQMQKTIQHVSDQAHQASKVRQLEEQAKAEAVRQAQVKAQQETQQNAQQQQQPQQQAQLKAQQEAQRKEQFEAQQKAQQQQSQQRQAQQQGQQQQAQQQQAQQQAQLKAQQEAQLKAQQEAQLKAQQEAQLKAQQEAQLKAQQQQQAQQQQAQQAQQAQQQQAQQAQQAQQQQAQQQQAGAAAPAQTGGQNPPGAQ